MKTNAMRILDSDKINYVVKEHSRPVFTVEEAAHERGVRISQIVKTMLVKKNDGGFCLILISGHKKLSLDKVSQSFNSKVHLASREEVTKVTGYEVGAVSPIGIRLKNTPIFFDNTILDEDYVDISSGDLTAGIELRSSDLLSLLNATTGDFSE